MYWLRISPGIEIIAWLLLSAIWWMGGWLLSSHGFRLRSNERLLSGLGIGLLLFIAFSNLLANFIPLTPAYWTGAAAILVVGVLAAWRSPIRPVLDKADLKVWPLFLALIGLTIIFTLINRGLAIFDDYHNLPLVSTIAAGDVPPHYFLNSESLLAFHYALHLFSASLVRIGGFTIWSAFDIGKAFSLGLSVILAYTWFSRITRHHSAGFWGSLLAVLGGGSRWLLVLVPAGLLAVISQEMQFLGSTAQSGSDLSSLLLSPWRIEGDGPIPFPSAFANGVFPPQVMSLGASGALPILTLFLLLLLSRRKWNFLSATLTGFILASLALSAEHFFVLVWGGLALAVFIGTFRKRDLSLAVLWAWILLLSLVIGVTAGGTLTQIISAWIRDFFGLPGAADAGFTGFGLRWPPSLISAHLGTLSFTQPGQMLVALAEIGLVLILAPWVTWWCWKRLRQGDWVIAGLGAAAVIGFLVPIFIRYLVRDRDIVRLASTALLIWLVLGFPLAWFAVRKGPTWVRLALKAGYAVVVFGGVVLFTLQLIAIPRPQFTNFVGRSDVLMSQRYWDQLGQDTQILDKPPHRAITLFGRSGGRAQSDLFARFPEWEALVNNPDPGQIAQAGYTYVYLDQRWWKNFTPEQRQAFQKACILVIAEESTADGSFRRLLDVSGCQ